jgi:hypothetical protein
MMAMTIFMGIDPRCAHPLQAQVMGNLRYAWARENITSPGNAWGRIKPRASSPHRL